MMTETDYRALPRLSNSDLSELDRYLFGKPAIKASAETLAFGSAFHLLILEPDQCTYQTPLLAERTPDEYFALMEMRKSVLNGGEGSLFQLLNNADRETVRFWICKLTGLPLKGRLDASVRPKHQHLIDLKTTSARSRSEFIDSCMTYDYDRQAAFYLSSDHAARFFEFVGVQKQPPFQVFRIAYHVSDPFVQRGRKKMDRLLLAAKEQLSRENGWRPSAWKGELKTL